jgi:Rad3-related DNA helicase
MDQQITGSRANPWASPSGGPGNPMPAATLETDPVFLQFITTEPGGGGNIVRILAERISPSPCGDTQFDRMVAGARLTLAQAQMTGLTNTQLESADELDVVLEDLIEFSHGATHWVAPVGNTSRELLRNAALASGLPRFPAPPLIGIDELSGIVTPTRAVDTNEKITQQWQSLLDGLLKLPLPLLSEMNWLLAKTEHPLKKLLKAAETDAVKDQFSTTFNSGKISLDKLFKDFTEIINRLGPDEENAGEFPVAADDSAPAAPVTADEIEAVLGAHGPLAKHLQGYEDRPEQLAMAKRVAESLNTGKHLIAEAGTGIGKSLAYLVPAILFAKRAERPVMISTHTKNLQAQLYEKDLPFLQKHLGMEFEPALLKGRPNYLCLRKFMYTLQESSAELDEDDRSRLLPVMTWATQTDTGDVTELAAFSREQSPELWDRLHTVGDDCLKRQCPFYKRCFVYKARGLTRTADVVVLNHSLVFSDLNIESGVLPPYNEIIFDEAHKLEDVATEHLACEVTPKRIYRVLNKLFRVAHGSAAGKGVLAALLANLELSRSNFTDTLLETIKTHILAAMQAIQPANEGSDVFFDTVRGWTERPEADSNEPPPQVYVPMERGRAPVPDSADDLTPPRQPMNFIPQRKKFNNRQPSDRRRFSAQSLRPDDAERFTEGKEAVIARLGRLRQALTALEEDFKEIRKAQVPRSRELLKEIEAQNLFLEELIHDIEFVIKGDEPNYVYWSEPLGKRGARVVAAPLDVSGLLHSQLYEKKRSIILASATLSVRDSEADDGAGLMPIRLPRRPNANPGEEHQATPDPLHEKPHPKSFEFLKTRIGLKLCAPEKLDELLLGSPFDYASQCRLFIPTFLPEPGGAKEKDFSAGFAAMVSDLVIASGGRAMVLYTSYAALEASARLLRKSLAAENIEVIAQGNDGSRESLLSRLKEGKRTVLLGTASFWEGVDVRGDALSLLIIAKLPFAVFTDPVIQGRCELLEANGKDPFLHFSIPQAILKLRQGFGRLIRSKTDRGVVILADKRVVTRRYGAAFLRALPAKAHAISSGDALTTAVREFLE